MNWQFESQYIHIMAYKEMKEWPFLNLWNHFFENGTLGISILMTRKLNCAGIVWIINVFFVLVFFSVFIRLKVICNLSHITFMIYKTDEWSIFYSNWTLERKKNQCWRENREIYNVSRNCTDDEWHCLFSALLINEGRPKLFLTIDANSVKDWKPHKSCPRSRNEWPLSWHPQCNILLNVCCAQYNSTIKLEQNLAIFVVEKHPYLQKNERQFMNAYRYFREFGTRWGNSRWQFLWCFHFYK